MGFRDKRKAGRSAIVPFIPGEDTGDRHARRLGANLLNEQAARENKVVSFFIRQLHNGLRRAPDGAFL